MPTKPLKPHYNMLYHTNQPHNTIPFHTIPHHTTLYHTTLYQPNNTTLYHTTLHYAIPHHTNQPHNTIATKPHYTKHTTLYHTTLNQTKHTMPHYTMPYHMPQHFFFIHLSQKQMLVTTIPAMMCTLLRPFRKWRHRHLSGPDSSSCVTGAARYAAQTCGPGAQSPLESADSGSSSGSFLFPATVAWLGGLGSTRPRVVWLLWRQQPWRNPAVWCEKDKGWVPYPQCFARVKPAVVVSGIKS